jgi:hypothetical protein
MPLLGFKFNLIRIVKGIVREARSYVSLPCMEANTIAQSSALRQLVQYGRRSRQGSCPSSGNTAKCWTQPCCTTHRRRCYNRAVGFCTNGKGTNPATVADAEPADDPLEPCCKFQGFSLSAKPYIIHCKLAHR